MITAYPVDAASIAWVPLRAGLSFRPLHFAPDGYSLQLRLEPGVTIPRHRHTGDVHAYNLEGSRELIETGERVPRGTYVYEPSGNIDTWRCVGDVPCIVQITLKGRVEYLDDRGEVRDATDTHTAREAYLRFCSLQGVRPDPVLFRGTNPLVSPPALMQRA
jgi:hypothetical protein